MKTMLRSFVSVAIVISLLLSTAIPIMADPVGGQITYNSNKTSMLYEGHIYKRFDISVPWPEAKVYCEALGGHLVTIESSEENNAVTSLFAQNSKNCYWIGLSREKNNQTWSWITGEPVSFTNWAPGEPNGIWDDSEYQELYVHYFGRDYTSKKTTGMWNDASIDGASYAHSFFVLSNYGFVCEWESTSINMPTEVQTNKIEVVPDSAFKNIPFIQSVSLPDTVSTIGSEAFYGCSSLKSVTIPISVSKIGNNAFASCDDLTDIFFLGEAPSVVAASLEMASFDAENVIIHYVSDMAGWTDSSVYDPVAGTWNGYKLEIWDPNTNTEPENTFGENGDNLTWNLSEAGVLIISGTGSMGRMKEGEAPWELQKNNIKKVVIESGVTSIGAYAFDGCTQLITVEIPSGIEIIGDLAFGDCSALKKINLPASVKTISQFAFANCSGLTSVTIPDGVVTIGKHAFYNCSSLTSVVIPGSVVMIGEYAFCNCNGLTDIELPEDLAEISEGVFYGCDSLVRIMIPASVKKIKVNAFIECDSLTSVYFRGNAPEIGVGQDRPFSGKEILYHVPSTSGWTDSVEYADGTWKVYHLDTWDGVQGNTVASLSTVDYLALSSLVYQDLPENTTIGRYLTQSLQLHNAWDETQIHYNELFRSLMEWEVIKTRKNEETGFYAAALRYQDKIVIAYRGSRPINDLNDPKDWWKDWIEADITMFLGGKSSQIGDAFSFYSAILSNYRGFEISVTGHSLGGGLADLHAAHSGLKGESFNSAPFLDVAYCYFPELGAANFKGVDSFSFVAHVNEKDAVGNWFGEYIKPKTIYKHTTSFGAHDLRSLVKRHGNGVRMADVKETVVKNNVIEQDLNGYTSLALGTSQSDRIDAAKKKADNVFIYGGDGNDILFGQSMFVENAYTLNEKKVYVDDVIVGGAGDDELDGRQGDDKYIYYKGSGLDRITDISGADELHFYGFGQSDSFKIETADTNIWINIYCNDKLLVKLKRGGRSVQFGNSFKVYVHRGSSEPTVENIETLFHKIQYDYHMEVMCPVDVDIVDATGQVVYTVTDGEVSAAYTEYGNFYVFEEEDGGYGKLLDLAEGYEARVRGVSSGTMDVILQEMKEDGSSKPSRITDVPITEKTVAYVTKTSDAQYELQLDNDSDGTVDETQAMDVIEGTSMPVAVFDADMTVAGSAVHVGVNLIGNDMELIAVVAFYNKGQQVDIAFEKVDASVRELEIDLTVAESFDTCKVFLLDGLETMMPLAVVTELYQ